MFCRKARSARGPTAAATTSTAISLRPLHSWRFLPKPAAIISWIRGRRSSSAAALLRPEKDCARTCVEEIKARLRSTRAFFRESIMLRRQVYTFSTSFPRSVSPSSHMPRRPTASVFLTGQFARDLDDPAKESPARWHSGAGRSDLAKTWFASLRPSTSPCRCTVTERPGIPDPSASATTTDAMNEVLFRLLPSHQPGQRTCIGVCRRGYVRRKSARRGSIAIAKR
mgnify:CR=1 FL=1